MLALPALMVQATAPSAAMIGEFGFKRILIGIALVLPWVLLRFVDTWLRRKR